MNSSKRFLAGQAMAEWLIGVALLMLVIVSLQGGTLEQIFAEVNRHYARYSHAMARP
jgi:hypothetical protein